MWCSSSVSTQMSPRWGSIYMVYAFLHRCHPAGVQFIWYTRFYTDVTPLGFNLYGIRVSTQMSPRWGSIYMVYAFLHRCHPVGVQSSVGQERDARQNFCFGDSCHEQAACRLGIKPSQNRLLWTVPHELRDDISVKNNHD